VVTVVGIVTRPRVGRSWVGIPVGASDCSVIHAVMTDCEAHPAYFQWVTASFPGVKRPGREANQSPPSIAEVKNEWGCTSSSPIHLHLLSFNHNLNIYTSTVFTGKFTLWIICVFVCNVRFIDFLTVFSLFTYLKITCRLLISISRMLKVCANIYICNSQFAVMFVSLVFGTSPAVLS
jgi:hypothetical protein